MSDRFTIEIDGWVLRTYEPIDDELREALAEYLRRIEEGTLETWCLQYQRERPYRRGGVCVDFPDGGELAALAHAHLLYGGRGADTITAEFCGSVPRDARTFRHPALSGCIDVVQRPLRQGSLF